MKADLAKREPAWLARWKQQGLYAQILARPTARRFVFHDGPPYANGHMHYGHVLNNALKDFVTRFRNIAGEHTRFVPGWDCHGLPIELNVDKQLGPKKREMTASQVREACRTEAEKWLDVQREERQRVGVLGTWDDPYLTMAPSFEGAIVRALKAFVERGLVYRGKKPVQWCSNDRTALAESEVEYIEKHVSPSVYVKFPATSAASAALKKHFPDSKASKFFAVIWTTTPWTLPANLAIALHPDVEYVVVDVERDGTVEGLLVAKPLAQALVKAAKLEAGVTIGETAVKGSVLEGLAFRHPWEDRDSKLVTAMYVETETGTGLVHTAPGHGRDDYVTGLKNHLEAYAPLDDAGRYNDELGDASKAMGLVGKTVWEANPIIVQAMVDRGVLLNSPNDKITHKYPGCWRCHRPLITRATTQWFIALDEPMNGDPDNLSLRARALAEIDRLDAEGHRSARSPGDAQGWIPQWGRERIHGMIANRPDWCISRQRVWGVPIPALHCEKCQHASLTPALLDHVAKLFAEKGSNAWYDDKVDVVPPRFKCEKCGSTGPFTRDQSIVDVWFESGSSFYAVCADPPDMGLPVDLYLEGSDQHRGWFHSSLLVGIAVTGKAPFKAVLTHGFTIDEKGEALSKSVINEKKARGEDVSHLDPLLMIKQQGAEVLRAWAAYEDYRGDVALSKEHFAQVADMYRKIRNAFRFMLQVMRNQPAPKLADVKLEPFDRWALARLGHVIDDAERAYRKYEFRAVFVGAVEYLGELSSTYLDVIKDWLYNDAEDSPRRRSTLAVVDQIVRAMATVLAPLLPFTAEDVWDHLPKREGDPSSVHLTRWPEVKHPEDGVALLEAADAVRELREKVNAALEPLVQAWGVERQAAKKANREPGAGESTFSDDVRIDHARDAVADVTTSAAEIAKLEPLKGVLTEALLLGELRVHTGAVDGVVVKRAAREPCERCWRRKPDVGANGLCARCAEAVRIYDARAAAGGANRESV
jgi:isoleucyl-tRNA synthetase